MRIFTTNHTNTHEQKLKLNVCVGLCGSWLIIFSGLCFLASCSRAVNQAAPAVQVAEQSAARPMAVLQPGVHPLWFQLTEEGPVHIVSIEEAVYSAALIPWPLAVHIHLFHEKNGDLVMAVNRYGFLKLSPYGSDQLALYRFPGGEYWRQYTTGGFVYYEENPVVLLYLDERFLETTYLLPSHRTWTFNMKSNAPFPLDVPLLENYSVDENWNVDTLRLGSDGYWYYRVTKRITALPGAMVKRTADLKKAGEAISREVFFGSVARETELSHPTLPPLPEGFVYTGIGRVGNSLFASWEEQVEFNIGAAGFVVINE